jgi:hypothetical protein
MTRCLYSVLIALQVFVVACIIFDDACSLGLAQLVGLMASDLSC